MTSLAAVGPCRRPREGFERVDSGKLVLVVGGKLRQELAAGETFKEWYEEAQQNGMARSVSDADVNQAEGHIEESANCKSNDAHVLALAQVSGARMLYTHDQRLIDDFKNKDLISDGKVYSTPHSGKFTPGHRRLLDTAKCGV